jgi:hypothetical protein
MVLAGVSEDHLAGGKCLKLEILVNSEFLPGRQFVDTRTKKRITSVQRGRADSKTGL